MAARLSSGGPALVLAIGLTAALSATAALAQSATDTEIATDFLDLELAGWRLPDPVETCLTGLSLKRLEPMAYGSEDLIDQPELVDPPGPYVRILRIDPEPGNPRSRVVQIEWLLHGPDGAARPLRDSFTFAPIGPAGRGGHPVMEHEPEHMVIRRECFGS